MPLTRLKSPQAAARWLTSWVTGQLRTDSRQVQPGDAFIAWPGYATDGRQHVAAALADGRHHRARGRRGRGRLRLHRRPGGHAAGS